MTRNEFIQKLTIVVMDNLANTAPANVLAERIEAVVVSLVGMRDKLVKGEDGEIEE